MKPLLVAAVTVVVSVQVLGWTPTVGWLLTLAVAHDLGRAVVDLRRWRQRRALRGTSQGYLLDQIHAGAEAMHELNRRRREGRRG